MKHPTRTLRGETFPPRTTFWKFCQAVLRILTTVLFDLKVYGKQNVPVRGGALLLTNHQSFLDPALLGVQLHRPISYMAKSELFEIPIFGGAIRAVHAFPVKQGRGDVGAIKQTINRLHEGHLLNIFPEGSRTENGEIGPIQSGVVLVIKRAAVPLIPVALDGSFDAWPRSRKIFRSRPIRVMFGPPLKIDGLKADEIVALVDRTLREMLAQLRRQKSGPRR